MEELIAKYIAKHGSVGICDGIEKADDTYECAMSQLKKDSPRKPKNKEGKVARAFQARFTSYKVIKRLEEMKTENKLLNSQVSDNIISLRNCKDEEVILKEHIVKLREEIAMSESERQAFRC